MTAKAVPANSRPAIRFGRTILLAACLASAVILGLVCWPAGKNPDRSAALVAAEQDRFAEAEPGLIRVQERHPQDVEVVRALALGYLTARRFGDAQLYLNRWCKLRPRDAEPFKRRAEFWLQQQHTARAADEIQTVLLIQPDDMRGRQILAQLLFLDARFSEAEQEAQRCLAAQPNNKETIYLLAALYQRQAQTAKALEMVERLLRLSPKSAPAVALQAEIFLETDQVEPAIELLTKAKEDPKLDLSFGLYPIDRQWISVMRLLASVQDRQLGLYQDGQHSTNPQVYAEQKMDQSLILYQLSQALARAGRDQHAKQVVGEMQLRRALAVWSANKLRDVNAGLQREVVDAYQAAGKPDEAVNFLTAILSRQPDAKGARGLLAECYEKQGKTELAAEQRRRSGQGP